MDLNKAEKILGLKGNYNLEDVKRSFRVMALKYHPDKNNEVNASEKFQEVYEAYEFLTNYDWVHINKEVSNDDNNKESETYDKRFNNVFEIFMKSLKSKDGSRIDPVLLNNLLRLISLGCKKLSKKVFEMFDKQTTLRMFSYALQLKDILGLTKEELSEMENCISSKNEENEVYILNPSLSNLLQDHIYILNHNEEQLYIPLWHSEIIYDISGQVTVVRCVPELPENINIDENNNLYINIEITFEKLLEQKGILIGEYTNQTINKIPLEELYIREKQKYILKNKGISEIDTKNIFNTTKRADLIFKIKITGLMNK